MTPERRELKSHFQELESRAKRLVLCKSGPIGEQDDDFEMADHWSVRLKTRLRQLGWSQRELAKRSGVSEDLIRKYTTGSIDKPRGNILADLARAVSVSVVWLEHGTSLRNMTIPLLGHVGAGEQFFPDSQGVNELVEIKAEDLDLFAVTVRGQSGLPVYRPGEIVVCSRSASLSENRYLNKDCVVMLRTGQAYLKKIVRGSIAGTYTLQSYNADPIENVSIEWAAPVTMVLKDPSLLITS